MEQKDQEIQLLDLGDFFKYLSRKTGIFVIVILMTLFLSAVYIFQVAIPIYEATSQIYVVNSQDSVINLSDLQIGSNLTGDYQWVMQTWEVHQTVIDNLYLPYTVGQMKNRLTISNPANTHVLTITFASESAKEAARIANEYAAVAREYISETMLTNKPTIISAALEPSSPARPQKARFIFISTVMACIVTVAVFLLVYMYNDRIRDASDLKKLLNVEPLTVIPFTEKHEKSRNKL